MTDARPVLMTADEYQLLEDIGIELMRQMDDRAMKVLTLSLKFKFAKPVEPELPSNVVPFPDTHSQRVGA